MQVSVAMCTYNGAKYIEEQLRSILNQTHPVDEIVICDDGSSDETMSIINRIKEETAFPIRTHVNHPNLGVCANFDKAIKLCEGEIIFLSDQDDVWMSNKVERIVNWFNDNPGKEVVFTNGMLLGEGKAQKKTLFDSVFFTKKAMHAFNSGFALELFLNFNRATGATMALKQSFIENLTFPVVPMSFAYHDAIISMRAIDKDTLGFIPESLIHYRIHSSQTAGINLNQNKKEAEYYLSPFFNHIELGEYAEVLKERVKFARLRQKFVYERNGWLVLSKQLGRYIDFYGIRGLHAVIYDSCVFLKQRLKLNLKCVC